MFQHNCRLAVHEHFKLRDLGDIVSLRLLHRILESSKTLKNSEQLFGRVPDLYVWVLMLLGFDNWRGSSTNDFSIYLNQKIVRFLSWRLFSFVDLSVDF